MEKLELFLLNSEDASTIKGGLPAISSCSKKGDSVCMPLVGDIKICAHYETSCPGEFTFACGAGDISCSANFSIIKPKITHFDDAVSLELE